MKLTAIQFLHYLGFRRHFIPAALAFEKAQGKCSGCMQTIRLFLLILCVSLTACQHGARRESWDTDEHRAALKRYAETNWPARHYITPGFYVLEDRTNGGYMLPITQQ